MERTYCVMGLLYLRISVATIVRILRLECGVTVALCRLVCIGIDIVLGFSKAFSRGRTASVMVMTGRLTRMSFCVGCVAPMIESTLSLESVEKALRLCL